MPIYEYECPKCGEFEVTQRITDAPLKRCQKCRSGVKKLISNTSFQLKGTGWYATDYAGKKGVTDKAEKESKSDASTKSDSTTKTESTSSSESKSSSSKPPDGGGKAAA